MSPVDLLLHPVRLRIVHAMSGGQAFTPTQLSAQMPDVARTSLYRQIGLLAKGGILEVEGEQRIRGAVERRYRLHRERVSIDAETAGAMSRAEHRRGFTAALAALLAEFNSYLDQDDADPIADLVSYRQGVLWLSKDQLTDVINEIRNVLVSRTGNGPSPDTAPYLVSTILFPIKEHP